MEKQPLCDCEVIHEEIVNSTSEKMLRKDMYIELGSLFKLFGDRDIHFGTEIRKIDLCRLHKCFPLFICEHMFCYCKIIIYFFHSKSKKTAQLPPHLLFYSHDDIMPWIAIALKGSLL